MTIERNSDERQLELRSTRKPLKLVTGGETLRVNRRIGATSEFGAQKVVLTPGASTTCSGTACTCTSCW
jgi:hypothetical protein